MDQPLLLALDQGTTSTRALLFDAHGQALAIAGQPLRQSYPADGWVEHDSEEIFEASVSVLREVLARSGRGLAEVAALGVTNQRETVVVWDKASGRPIHPAIVWQDRRTAATCDRLQAAGAEARMTGITGLLLDPYFSATKIAWILDHTPGARARAEAGELLCGTIDTWLIWRLTGGAVHATDATNASRTALFDLDHQVWSDEMLALFDVPAALLPRVLDTAGDYGQVAPEFLGAPLAIRGVVGDQQGALMGQGCVRAGQMKATYGTGCFLLLHTGEQRAQSRSRLLTTVAARLDGRARFALEGSIFIAGAAIEWMQTGLGVERGPEAVEALARSARPGHGVVAVPAFTGLGAPWWDAQARGAIFGLTRDSGRAEIAAALFDACALQTRDLIEAMGADAPSAFAGDQVCLRMDGGMARSAWFCQRLADLTGITTQPSVQTETTALGAALFAGLGAGVYGSAEEAAAVAHNAALIRPDTDKTERDALYGEWLKALSRLRGEGLR